MKKFNQLSKNIISKQVFKDLKKYPSHGNTTLYTHSINVALLSYKFVQKHHIKCDEKQLIKGALLHDLYLYNWKEKKVKFHLFKHPKISLETTKQYYRLTKKEENIILTHMFPITIWTIPKCKEAWIVCLFDKIEAIKELIKTKSLKGFIIFFLYIISRG